MLDFQAARENMIESQVRPNGITDSRLIAAMAGLPREHFVDEARRGIAYMDEDLPIGTDSTGAPRWIMEPMAFARLVQAAAIAPGDIVLDIGCGSGYSTAVLAQLAQSVVAVEHDAAMAAAAGEVLSSLDINNAVVLEGDHASGCPGEAPFDVILLNGRVTEVPEALFAQLRDGGRLVAAIGEHEVAQAMVYTASGSTHSGRYVCTVSVPPLAGFAARLKSFVF